MWFFGPVSTLSTNFFFLLGNLCISFQESIDRALWSSIFSSLLGNGSAVYEEVGIGKPTIPHGFIDVVGGLMDDSKQCVGVQLQGSVYYGLTDLIGASAKTRTTLPTKALSKCI